MFNKKKVYVTAAQFDEEGNPTDLKSDFVVENNGLSVRITLQLKDSTIQVVLHDEGSE